MAIYVASVTLMTPSPLPSPLILRFQKFNLSPTNLELYGSVYHDGAARLDVANTDTPIIVARHAVATLTILFFIIVSFTIIIRMNMYAY